MNKFATKSGDYARKSTHYTSDLTDRESMLIEPLLPEARTLNRLARDPERASLHGDGRLQVAHAAKYFPTLLNSAKLFQSLAAKQLVPHPKPSSSYSDTRPGGVRS